MLNGSLFESQSRIHFPCYAISNSLIRSFKFPVIFLLQKCADGWRLALYLGFLDISCRMRRLKLQNFPVNGNLIETVWQQTQPTAKSKSFTRP